MIAVADRISIDFDLLEQHARRVDLVASDVALAQDAASSINVGGGAFGLMCAFLVPPAALVSSLATSALASAQGMVERSARELRAVGTDFGTTEDAIVTDLAEFVKALDA